MGPKIPTGPIRAGTTGVIASEGIPARRLHLVPPCWRRCSRPRVGRRRWLRLDNGPEMISQALQRFYDGKAGMSYIPPGCP